jgi:hypothetical protein
MSRTHFHISRIVFEMKSSQRAHGSAYHIDYFSYVRGNFYFNFTLCSTYVQFLL